MNYFYNWETKETTYSYDNEQYPHILAIERLLNFANNEGNPNADYMTKCDILRVFKENNN